MTLLTNDTHDTWLAENPCILSNRTKMTGQNPQIPDKLWISLKIFLYLPQNLMVSLKVSLYNICAQKIITIHQMSETQLRSYRLTSMEEPTDEMLHAIMEKVAIAARESSARVAKIHRQRLAEIMARKAGKIATAK